MKKILSALWLLTLIAIEARAQCDYNKSTNPFTPQNTEWNTMRNRFNWMDYFTLHEEKR
jgi:hypothetical protein